LRLGAGDGGSAGRIRLAFADLLAEFAQFPRCSLKSGGDQGSATQLPRFVTKRVLVLGNLLRQLRYLNRKSRSKAGENT
jgi:hypothetical protein